MKKSFLTLLQLVVFLVIISPVYAQIPVVSPGATTTTTPAIEQSDFAKDLQEGEDDTANDQEAQQNQQDQKDNEDVGVNEQGEVSNGQEGVDEQDMKQSNNELNGEGENEDAVISSQPKSIQVTGGYTQSGMHDSQKGKYSTQSGTQDDN